MVEERELVEPRPTDCELGRATMSDRSLMGRWNAISVPSLTLVAVLGALVYNAGFFSTVGFHFINLFSIQEHLVFALTGSAILITLTSIAAQVKNQMVDYYRMRQDRLTFYFATALYVAAFVLIAGVFVLNANEDAGPITAAWAGLGFVFAAMLVFVLQAATFPVLIALFAILETFAFGSYYANFLMFSQTQHSENWAKNPTDEKFGVLRVGSDYSLLISSSHVVSVVRTTDLYIQSESKP